jgi:hypothetical protein
LRRLTWFGLLWLAVAVVAVAAPGHFFAHYFLILMPPLAVLSAVGAFAAARFVAPARSGLVALTMMGVVAAGPLLFDLRERLVPGLHMGMPDASARVAAAIRAEMRPGDVVFVANHQPVVYFLTGSPLPTRFPFPAHLTGGFANLAGEDMDAEVARIMATRPRFVVLDRGYWHTMRPGAERVISPILAADYTLAHRISSSPGPIEIHRLRAGE